MQFWVSIFDLPHEVAPITTPWVAASERRPVITNSRAKMTTTTQAQSSDLSTRITRTVITMILSTRGSRNLPNSVT